MSRMNFRENEEADEHGRLWIAGDDFVRLERVLDDWRYLRIAGDGHELLEVAMNFWRWL